MGWFDKKEQEVLKELLQPIPEKLYSVTLYFGNGLTATLDMPESHVEDVVDKMSRGVSAGTLRSHDQMGGKFAYCYKEIKALKAIPKETNEQNPVL